MYVYRSKTMLDGLRRALGAPEPLLQTAALPWRNGPDGLEVLLITSRGTRRWILPKGWPEKGEMLWQSAEREAHEEAGVKGVTSPEPVGSYRYVKQMRSGAMRPCEVRVFALEVEGEDRDWRERGERRKRWMKPAKAARLVAEPDLAALLAEFGGKP